MDLDESSAKRVGTTLRDKWVLERLIGVGGMASVYLGRHKIGRLEAIKILHSEIATSEQLRVRFEQEARAVNSFRHPGVVEVRDVDVTEDGAPFLVMELLEGESLADRARREPPLTATEAVRIASEVLDVLGAAHERQIIHRDIKPDNLFLTRSGAVKVLDFGIARVRSAGGPAMATRVGVTLGTMAYMPPEQARGLEIDGRVDLYAVGATLYRLLSGRIVHDATTDAELVMKAMSEPAPPLGSVAPAVAAHICAVVDRALAFDRADRYPDARTMKADLDAVGRGEPPPYATAAPALPVHAPSSSLFALRESFFGDAAGSSARNEATFVPPAKAPPGSPAVSSPAPSTGGVPATPAEAATSVGVAPEVARTRIAARGVPSAALPSAPAVRAAQAPNALAAAASTRDHAPATYAESPARTMVSGPSTAGVVMPPVAELHPIVAKTRTPPGVVYAVAAGVAVFLLLGVVAVLALVARVRGHGDDETHADPVLAEPSPVGPATSSTTGSGQATATLPPAALPPTPAPPSKQVKGKHHGRN